MTKKLGVEEIITIYECRCNANGRFCMSVCPVCALKFLCQSHWVRVKVTAAKMGCTRVTEYTHLWVVHLRWGGNIVSTKPDCGGVLQYFFIVAELFC